MGGWIGIAIFVTAYDLWAAATGKPTLSAEYAMTAQKRPVAVSATTLYLVVHLYGYWPRNYDPLCLGLTATGRCAERVTARRESNPRPAA